MKRLLGGTIGILATQAMLWPHHHILGLAIDAVSILALAGANTDRKAAR